MDKIVCYCRVSTNDQNIESQLQAIKRYCANQQWQLSKIYQDEGISGSKDNRPALDQLKQDVIKGKVSGIVCYKFDRIARSSSHLLECLQLFQRYNVDFISVTEGIDTSTSVGKMVYTFLSAIAEFEKSIIQERVKSGIQRAQQEGKHCGRPRKGFDVAEAIRLKNKGWSLRRIADKTGVSYGTVNRTIKSVTKTCEMTTS